MRKFIFTALMIMVMGVAYASCGGGRLVSFVDRDGAVATWTTMSCDGKYEYSNYPAPNTDGRISCPVQLWDGQCKGWLVRNSVEELDGLTTSEQAAKVDDTIAKAAESLLTQPYQKQANEDNLAERKRRAEAIVAEFNKAAGEPVVVTTAKITVDATPLSTEKKELTVSTTGIVSEKAIATEALVK